tara:strand:- start:171 stop:602 length:432 start_codon:yes stop_codon:yes gene_type:complete
MSFKNLEAFKKRLEKNLITKAHKNVFDAVKDSTQLVESHAKKSIQAGGSGQSVQKYNPNRVHTQSKANEPPATDTGFLVSQISISIDPKADGSVVGQIISSAPYSKALEFGTVNMQPRPFMHPALRKNKNKILKIFKREGIIR